MESFLEQGAGHARQLRQGAKITGRRDDRRRWRSEQRRSGQLPKANCSEEDRCS